jgi:transposase
MFAAAATHITIAWLPFHSPELNPLEDSCRQVKTGAANQVYSTLEALTDYAVACLMPASPLSRRGLRTC